MRRIFIICISFLSSFGFAGQISFQKQIELNEYMAKAVAQLPGNQVLLNKLKQGLSQSDQVHFQKAISNWNFSPKTLSVQSQFGSLVFYNYGQRIMTISIGGVDPLEIKLNDMESIKINPNDIHGSLDAFFKFKKSAQFIRTLPFWLQISETQANADESVGKYSGLGGLAFLYTAGARDIIKDNSTSIIVSYLTHNPTQSSSGKYGNDKNEYFFQKWLQKWRDSDRWKVSCSASTNGKPNEARGVLNISDKKFNFDIKDNVLKLSGPKGVTKIGLETAPMGSNAKNEIDNDGFICAQVMSGLGENVTAQRRKLAEALADFESDAKTFKKYKFSKTANRWIDIDELSKERDAMDKRVFGRKDSRGSPGGGVASTNTSYSGSYDACLYLDKSCGELAQPMWERKAQEAKANLEDKRTKLASTLLQVAGNTSNNLEDVKKCINDTRRSWQDNTGCFKNSTLEYLRSCVKVDEKNAPPALLSNSNFIQAKGTKLPFYKLTYQDCDENGDNCKSSDAKNFSSQYFDVKSTAENDREYLNTRTKELKELTKVAANHVMDIERAERTFQGKSGVKVKLHNENGLWKLDDVPPANKASSKDLSDYKEEMIPLLEKKESYESALRFLQDEIKGTAESLKKQTGNEDPRVLSEISSRESKTFEAYSLTRALVGCCGSNECRASMYSTNIVGKPGGIQIKATK